MNHLLRISALSALLTFALPASMLYVADDAAGTGSTHSGSVFTVTQSGAVNELISNLINPKAIAISGTLLFVSEGDQIRKFDATTGADLGVFASLVGVDSIVVDLLGNVFASSSSVGLIKKFNSAGVEQGMGVSGLAEPNALALDGNGHLLVLVAPSGGFSWERFNVLDLSFVDTLTSAGLNTSYGSTYKDGTLYYSDFFGDIMQVDSLGDTTTFASTGLAFHWGLAFAPNGDLYAANNSEGTIERFDSAGTHLGTFSSAFVSPTGIAFASIPEPGTFLLLGGALVFLGTRRRQLA